MAIPVVQSISAISKQYETGEHPVLVMCSDRQLYVCKYVRGTASAYKLACEYIGACFAKSWSVYGPHNAFVEIKSAHWGRFGASHPLGIPAFGCRLMADVLDVTPSMLDEIKESLALLRQLMHIALFDFWIANEDRNANNANLLFETTSNKLVAIDYGCVFNTATFDYPLSQLTSTDTILNSDLFQRVRGTIKRSTIERLEKELRLAYENYFKKSQWAEQAVLEQIPQQWNLPTDAVRSKVQQLFSPQWKKDVWENFQECLNENIL